MSTTASANAHKSNSQIGSVSRRQDEVNRAVYYSRSVFLYYLSKALLPVESACFARFPPEGRDILDIGVGAGRTARYLAPRARRYEAIDYSPVMVKHVRKTLPQISVREADFRDLRMFEDASFDFVLATANVIDALSHEDRMRALNEASRVLRPGGILGLSAHNLHYLSAFEGPRMTWSLNPVRLGSSAIQYLLGARNHRRVGPLRTRNPEYALINDTGHFFACLHYYVTRPVMSSQLEKAGMKLIEVYGRSGSALADDQCDSENPWLFYVAERTASGLSPAARQSN